MVKKEVTDEEVKVDINPLMANSDHVSQLSD